MRRSDAADIAVDGPAGTYWLAKGPALTMTTVLANRLGETRHVSPLLRRARAMGIGTPATLLALAVARGCSHYAGATATSGVADPGRAALGDEELAALLMLGELPFNPVAIRCAAQLLGGEAVNAQRVVSLARRERCERVLAHIARAGMEHDQERAWFWSDLLVRLGDVRPAPAGVLPHWTRFGVMNGMRRGTREVQFDWLRPRL